MDENNSMNSKLLSEKPGIMTPGLDQIDEQNEASEKESSGNSDVEHASPRYNVNAQFQEGQGGQGSHDIKQSAPLSRNHLGLKI